MEDVMHHASRIRRIRLAGAVAAVLFAGCTGDTGGTALVATTPEPPGAHCANGGTRLETGVDANMNGVLDPGEVNASETTYICNGSSRRPTLVKTSPQPPRPHCPSGGVKIEMGVDANGNGLLDPSEVNPAQTTYVCGGTPGPSATSTGLAIAIKGVSDDASGAISVRFSMKDSRGFPVDKNGIYTLNTPIAMRFSLSYLTKDPDGNVLPNTVLTRASWASAQTRFQPTAYNPGATTTATTRTPAVGLLVEDVPLSGEYTYTFPTADVQQTDTSGAPNGVVFTAVAYDASKLGNTHVVW